MYSFQMEGQITWEDYKDVARSCREKIRRTKAQLKLGLRDNKKVFYKYSKRRVKECLHHLLNAGGSVMTVDEKKADELNTFFVSVFSIVQLSLRVLSSQSWKLVTES